MLNYHKVQISECISKQIVDSIIYKWMINQIFHPNWLEQNMECWTWVFYIALSMKKKKKEQKKKESKRITATNETNNFAVKSYCK